MKLIAPRSRMTCLITRQDPSGNNTRSRIEIEAGALVNGMYQMGVTEFKEMPNLCDSYFESPRNEVRPFNTRIRIAQVNGRTPVLEDYIRLCEHLVIDIDHDKLDAMRTREAERIYAMHNFGEASILASGDWRIHEENLYSRKLTLLDPEGDTPRDVMFEIEFQEHSSLPVFLKPNVITWSDEPEMEDNKMATVEKLYGYYVNLDERGEFYADVRDHEDNSIYEIRNNEDGTLDLVDDGFMEHNHDLVGLEAYLKDINVIEEDAELLSMSEFEARLEEDEVDAEMAI